MNAMRPPSCRASAVPTASATCCNARLRDELLNGEVFYTLREAQIVIESWRRLTTRSGLTPQSDISHQHQRCSCLHSPRGPAALRRRLRRPRWRNGQP
jgi:hypothetical protein